MLAKARTRHAVAPTKRTGAKAVKLAKATAVAPKPKQLKQTIDMDKVLKQGHMPEPKEIKPANRKQRRDIVERKSGCAVCHQMIRTTDGVCWYGGQSAHQTCAEARNEALVLAQDEMDEQDRQSRLRSAKEHGLVLPEGLLLPG